MWENVLSTSVVVLVFGGLYFLINAILSFRSMAKQKKHFAMLHQSLKKGQEVMINGGIYGTVLRLNDESIDLEVKSGAVMKVSRFAVSQIVDKARAEQK